MRENRAMVSPGGQEYLSDSSLQTHYPPVGTTTVRIQLSIGQTHEPGGTFYVVMPPCENFPDPSLPFGTTIWYSGSSQGDAQVSHTWIQTIVTPSLFNIVFQTCLFAFSQRFLCKHLITGTEDRWMGTGGLMCRGVDVRTPNSELINNTNKTCACDEIDTGVINSCHKVVDKSVNH
jgi:hypothetical protein